MHEPSSEAEGGVDSSKPASHDNTVCGTHAPVAPSKGWNFPIVHAVQNPSCDVEGSVVSSDPLSQFMTVCSEHVLSALS